jgi:seryl-tRNA synthetase
MGPRRLIQETRVEERKKHPLQRDSELRKSGADATDKIEYQRSLGRKIEEAAQGLKAVEEQWEQILLVIPNIPHASVPVGTTDEDNKVVKTWGEKPSFDFKPKAHWDLGEGLDILDFKRAAKITGSRFTLYKASGALLERPLINFMLDLHVGEHGYTEVLPPFMVNRTSMTGTGQLRSSRELFHLEGVDYFLIPPPKCP